MNIKNEVIGENIKGGKVENNPKRKYPLVQVYVHKDLDRKLVQTIRIDCLGKDSLWHFFHEGSYCLFRVEKKSVARLSVRLKKEKVQFELQAYEDPHKLVRKYQDLFIPMFHSFTMLGLYGDTCEFQSALERIAHCFINMAGCDEETSALMLLWVFRMQINMQNKMNMVSCNIVEKFARLQRERPEEYEKLFTAVQPSKAGR